MVRSILLLAAVGLASASADKTQKLKGVAGHVLSFASASAPLEHKQLTPQVHKSLAAGISSRSPGLFGRQTGVACDLDQEVCDNGCMPIGDVCCNDGSGYCPATYTCNDGQTTCSPGFGSGGGSDGGDDDDDDSGSGSGDVLCDLDEEECDGNCMPIGSVCCNDGSGWCQANYTCDDGLSTCSPVLGGGGGSGSGDDDEGDDDDTGSDLDFCDVDQEECDGFCMPLGSVCCNDGSGYCMENYTCDDGLSTCSPAFGSGGGDDDDEEDDEDDALPTLPSLTFPTATATSSSSSRTLSETDSTSTDTSDGSGSNDDTSDGNDESGSNDVNSGDDNNDNDGGSGAGALVPSFLAGVLAVAMVPLLL